MTAYFDNYPPGVTDQTINEAWGEPPLEGIKPDTKEEAEE